MTRLIMLAELAAEIGKNLLPKSSTEWSEEAFAIPDPQDFFIEPGLRVQTHTRGASECGNLYAISARGASGKSEVARWLAAELEAPLWRTEIDATLNRTSLELKLVKYAQTTNAESAIKSAKNAVIVVDALDEAQARVSLESWEEFTASVGEFCQAGLNFVIIGRQKSVEHIIDAVKKLGIGIKSYFLEPFDRENQKQYVRQGVLRSRADKNESDIHLDRCIELLLDSVVRATAKDVENLSFDGYPPVLNALISDLKNQDNYFAYGAKLETENRTRTSKRLKEICHNILIREQRKLEDKGDFDTGLKGTLYTPSEQMRMLLGKAFGSAETELPEGLSPGQRVKYAEVREQMMTDHPFTKTGTPWASAIFEAYCISEEPKSVISQSNLWRIAKNNPYLAEFLIDSSKTKFNESIVSAVHTSLNAAFPGLRYDENAQSLLFARIHPTSDPGKMRYVAEVREEEQDITNEIANFDFDVDDHEILVFSGEMSRIAIIAPGRSVWLQSLERAPQMGPVFDVEADEVEFEFSEFKVIKDYRGDRQVPSAFFVCRLPKRLPRFDPGPEDSMSPVQYMTLKDTADTLPYPWHRSKFNLFERSGVKKVEYFAPATLRIVSLLKQVQRGFSGKPGRISRQGWKARVGVSPRSELAEVLLRYASDMGLVQLDSDVVIYNEHFSFTLFETPFDNQPAASTPFGKLDEQSAEFWRSFNSGVIERLAPGSLFRADL